MAEKLANAFTLLTVYDIAGWGFHL